MKRYIHEAAAPADTVHFTDLFDSIAAIFYVDDLNQVGDIFASYIYSSISDEYSDEDLQYMSAKDAHAVTDLHLMYRLLQLCPNKLSYEQRKELGALYRVDPNDLMSGGIHVVLDKSDVSNILDMLKAHKFVQGPYYRANEPEKNFAEMHDLNIGPKDYAHILHSLTVDECTILTPYKTFDYSAKHPGDEIIVFNVDKDIILSNGDSIGNFKVYIKIDLTRTFETSKSPIVLISFHE